MVVLKSHRSLILLLVPAGALLFAANAAQAQWGTLKGQILLEGDTPKVESLVVKGDEQVKDALCRAFEIPDESLLVDPGTRGIANVFVFLPRAPAKIYEGQVNGSEEPLVFDQQGCRFIPHTMVVRTGQKVLVKSNDATNHNTHTSPIFNTPENFLVSPGEREGQPISFRIAEPVPVKVTCDLHPWMSSFWLVIDHPYGAITDEHGEFVLPDLPAGTHALRVWHERTGWIEKSFSVEVSEGETTQLEPVVVPVEKLSLPRP